MSVEFYSQEEKMYVSLEDESGKLILNNRVRKAVWEEIVSTVPDLSYFLNTSVKAAQLRGSSLGSVLVICRNAGLTKQFVKALESATGTKASFAKASYFLRPGDFIGIINAMPEKDILSLELDEKINPRDWDFNTIAKQAFATHTLDLTIGKGASANNLHVDLPDCTHIFSAAQSDDYTEALRNGAKYFFNFNSLPAELLYKFELIECAEDEELVINYDALSKLAELLCSGRGTPAEYIQRLSDYIYINALEKKISLATVSEVFGSSSAYKQPGSPSGEGSIPSVSFADSSPCVKGSLSKLPINAKKGLG